MRQKLIFALAGVASIIIVWNLYTILLNVPDEANQGAIFRIFYFHLPAALTSFAGFYVAMGYGVAYLIKKDLRYDAIAAPITEVSFAFAIITLITGMIWGRIIWGIWWAWDPRLTSYLICLLLYGSYFILRRAIDDPGQRATLSAVLSIFASIDIVIVWKSIEWWRTQHPAPVLSIRNGGGMAPGMEAPIYWNLLAMLMLSSALILVRMRQENMQREIEALRRYAHAI
jgi:heme exporter protein C